MITTIVGHYTNIGCLQGVIKFYATRKDLQMLYLSSKPGWQKLAAFRRGQKCPQMPPEIFSPAPEAKKAASCIPLIWIIYHVIMQYIRCDNSLFAQENWQKRPFVSSHNFCHPKPSCYPQLQQEIAWPNSPQQFKQMLYLSPKPVITGSPCCSSQLLSSLCLSCHHPPRRHHHHQDACSKMWNISRA